MESYAPQPQEIAYVGSRAEYTQEIFSSQTELLVSEYFDTLLNCSDGITEELLQTLEVNGIIFGDDDAAIAAIVYTLEEPTVTESFRLPLNHRYGLLQAAVNRSLYRKCIHYCMPADGRLVCLVSFPRLKKAPAMHQQNLVTMLYLASEELKSSVEAELCAQISVAIGTLVYGVAQIPESYQSALDLLRYSRFMEQPDYDILMAPTPEVLNCTRDEMTNVNLTLYRMIKNLRQGENLEPLRCALDKAMADALSFSAHSLKQLRKNVFSILQSVLSHMISLGILSPAFSEESDAMEAVRSAKTHQTMLLATDKLWDLLLQYHTQQHPNLQPDKIDAVRSYIDENYTDFNLSVDSLAEMVKISQPTLSIQFKKKLGSSITDYISLLRIDKARVLIQQTDFPISEIAAQSGFGSLPSLYRAFRKYENISPGQLRQK